MEQSIENMLLLLNEATNLRGLSPHHVSKILCANVVSDQETSVHGRWPAQHFCILAVADAFEQH